MALANFVCALDIGSQVSLPVGTSVPVYGMVAPTDMAISLDSFILTFNGVKADDKAIEISLLLYSVTGGSPSLTGGTSITPCPTRSKDDVARGTYKHSMTGAPTGTGISSKIAGGKQIHPQAGIGRIFNYGKEIKVSANQALVLWCKAITTAIEVKPEVNVTE